MMPKLNIREVVAKICEDESIAKVPKYVLESIIRATFDDLAERLSRGETVSIKGLGKFEYYHNIKGRRSSYNFHTGEIMKTKCKPKVKFYPSFEFEVPNARDQESVQSAESDDGSH